MQSIKEPPAPTFYNLTLSSIYGNDGDTILRMGVIININKYRWEKVQELNTFRMNFDYRVCNC